MAPSLPLAFGSLSTLRRPGRLLERPAGHVLARTGDTSDACYVVVRGRVEARRDGHVLGWAGPGEIIGELAPLGGGPRRADLVASEPVTLLALRGEDLRASASTRPRLLDTALRARAAA